MDSLNREKLEIYLWRIPVQMMHDDIDMAEYYSMDPKERRLRNQKANWYMRYVDGKISREKYILSMARVFAS